MVLIGRGAGFILPRETTLHVRMVAPLQERIAYMSQWLRLPVQEAAEKVRTARRGPGGVHQHAFSPPARRHPSVRHAAERQSGWGRKRARR